MTAKDQSTAPHSPGSPTPAWQDEPSGPILMSEMETPALPQTSEELLPLLYDELRRLAASQLDREQPGQTLQPTALVHEAWLRLGAETSWNSPAHFFGAAAQAMRRILIDRARAKGCQRRGGGARRVELETLDLAWTSPPEDLLDLDAALTRLEAEDPAAAQLVMLRFFAGVPNAEAARLCEMSESTAKRTWTYARAFLHRELSAN